MLKIPVWAIFSIYGRNCTNGSFTPSITFEPLNQISKTQLFFNLPTLGQNFLMFNYFVEFKSFFPYVNFL